MGHRALVGEPLADGLLQRRLPCFLQGERHELGAALDTLFFEDMADVVLDRAEADIQTKGDGFVG